MEKEKALIKPPVEVRYQGELEALKSTDTGRRPDNWQMSPQAVRTFILGSSKPIVHEGKEYHIEKKYFGNDALVERCIVTLAGNRGLMLVGEPGTAKTMLSELLSAAISTAEAVSVYFQAMITGYYYGDAHIEMDCLVQNLVGAVVKENQDDLEKVKEYFNTVIRDKSDREGGLWKKYYEARKWLR